MRGFVAVWRGHEIVKRLLEGVCLQKPVGEVVHRVHGGATFLRELAAMGEGQSP